MPTLTNDGFYEDITTSYLEDVKKMHSSQVSSQARSRDANGLNFVHILDLRKPIRHL